MWVNFLLHIKKIDMCVFDKPVLKTIETLFQSCIPFLWTFLQLIHDHNIFMHAYSIRVSLPFYSLPNIDFNDELKILFFALNLTLPIVRKLHLNTHKNFLFDAVCEKNPQNLLSVKYLHVGCVWVYFRYKSIMRRKWASNR